MIFRKIIIFDHTSNDQYIILTFDALEHRRNSCFMAII